MSVIPIRSEASSRGARMLRTALGPEIAAWLEDVSVIEVMLNPDGRLWIDRLGAGIADTGKGMSAADGERIIRLVAHHVGAEVHARAPRVSAELPETGERFEGLLPPVVAAPSFAIRKPAVAVFKLGDYVAAGIMAQSQADALTRAVGEKKNILVAGGTSTGKTTLTNALLAEVAKTDDRVVLIEDTRELQCAAPNLVSLRTKDGVASLSDLVRSALRLRPDRIPIGEVRGAEALDLLKAWDTGHPGGVGTIHAGSALGTLRRMEQLIQESVVTVPRALIAALGRGGRVMSVPQHAAGFPPALATLGQQLMMLPKARAAYVEEMRWFEASARQLLHQRDGALSAPLVVLSRARREFDGTLDNSGAEDVWRDMQARMSLLSTNTDHWIAAGAGHQIHADRPDLVLLALTEVARAGVRSVDIADDPFGLQLVAAIPTAPRLVYSSWLPQ